MLQIQTIIGYTRLSSISRKVSVLTSLAQVVVILIFRASTHILWSTIYHIIIRGLIVRKFGLWISQIKVFFTLKTTVIVSFSDSTVVSICGVSVCNTSPVIPFVSIITLQTVILVGLKDATVSISCGLLHTISIWVNIITTITLFAPI